MQCSVCTTPQKDLSPSVKDPSQYLKDFFPQVKSPQVETKYINGYFLSLRTICKVKMFGL